MNDKNKKEELFLAKVEYLSRKYDIDRYILLTNNASSISGFSKKEYKKFKKVIKKSFDMN